MWETAGEEGFVRLEASSRTLSRLRDGYNSFQVGGIDEYRHSYYGHLSRNGRDAIA